MDCFAHILVSFFFLNLALISTIYHRKFHSQNIKVSKWTYGDLSSFYLVSTCKFVENTGEIWKPTEVEVEQSSYVEMVPGLGLDLVLHPPRNPHGGLGLGTRIKSHRSWYCSFVHDNLSVRKTLVLPETHNDGNEGFKHSAFEWKRITQEIRAATNQNELCQERSTGNYQYCWKNALWSMLSRGLSVHRANVVHGHFSVAVCPWPASLGSKKISGHECAHSVPELRIRESLPALQFIFKKCISRRIVPEAHWFWDFKMKFDKLILWNIFVAVQNSKALPDDWDVHSENVFLIYGITFLPKILTGSFLVFYGFCALQICIIFYPAMCRRVPFTTDLVANILHEYFKLFLLRLPVSRINATYPCQEPSWTSVYCLP